MKWPSVTLNDLFEIARGGSPRPIDAYVTDDPGGINWIMIGDASEGSKYITRTKKRIRKEGVQRSRMVYPGDFLLTNSMSFGKPYILQTKGCIHDGWLVLKKRKDNVDADFFYHLLGSTAVYSEFKRLAAGATVKNLNIDLVKAVKIPLPPLDEQRRITAILDKADLLRQKRRLALQKLDLLTNSIFFEFFGRPASNPRRLKTVRLGEIAQFVGGGTPSRDVPAYFQGNICWATSKDMKGEILEGTEEHITTEAIKHSATKLVEPGAVLVVVKSKILMHRLPVLINKVPTCFGQDLKAIVLQNGLSARYLARHMRVDQHRLLDRARGINTEGLTLDHLREYEVLEPTGAEVRTYDLIEGRIESERNSQMVGLELLERQFSALEHRAFRGEL